MVLRLLVVNLLQLFSDQGTGAWLGLFLKKMADGEGLDVEACCTEWLAKVDGDFLTALCDEYRLEVPAEKVGKTNDLRKLVLRYLSSEALEGSDDKGASVFAKLFRELKEELGEDGVKSEAGISQTFGHDTDRENPRLVVQKLKLKSDFKIKGAIGDPKQSGTLDYSSLVFQMKQGREQGFSSKEICAGVIQAIKPGHSLRGFLESKGDVTEDALLQILRSHLSEKDSTSFFHDLSNCVQKSGESAHAFVVNALLLREKVAKISNEEGFPFPANVLRNRFFHTVYTGLKSNNIRMELQPILKQATISDENLLEEVNKAAANEQERQGKVRSKIEVNSLTGDENLSSSAQSHTSRGSRDKNDDVVENKSEKPSSTDKLLVEISKLTAKVNELSSVKSEISELRKQIHGTGMSDFANRARRASGGRRVNFRCANCESANNSYCNHCFKCLSDSHRQKDCKNLPPN